MAIIEVTPLMLACQNNDANEVKKLLAQGAQVDEKDSTQRTALFYCAENTNLDCITQLVKAKARVNQQDQDGYSILHLAVINGNQQLVDYLINQGGADVNINDSEMHSAVHWSVVCGQAKILDILLKKNADPETADIHGAFPIHYAAQMCGNVDIWDETLRRDQSQSLQILKKLIDQKVKIDVEDFDQRNPLIWAASSGSTEALGELFKAGSNPNKYEKDGLTALHCAASRGHLECIKMLVETCHCDMEQKDFNKCTPIFYASTLGQVEAVKLLLKYNCKLDVQDIKGRTVYHSTAAKGQLKCLKLLCEKDATIWLRNRKGDYPIHEAYYNKQTECVYYLLDTIKDKNIVKVPNIHDGRTLLHLAAAENDLKLCKRLIQVEGADVNPLMKTSLDTYMTPYDVAVSKNARECAKYLKSKGGENGEAIAEKAANVIKAKMKLHSAKKRATSGANENKSEEKKKQENDDDNDPSLTQTTSKKQSKQSQEKDKAADNNDNTTTNNNNKNPTKDKKSNSSEAAAAAKKPSVQESSSNKAPLKKKDSDQTVGSMNSKTKKDSSQDNQATSKRKNEYRNKSAQTLISSTDKKLLMVSGSSSTSVNSFDSVSSKEERETTTVIKNSKTKSDRPKETKPSSDNIGKKPPAGAAALTSKTKSQNALPSIPPASKNSDQAKNNSTTTTSKNKMSDRSHATKPSNNEPARKPSAENTRRSNLKRTQLVSDRPVADLNRLKKPQSLPKIDQSSSKKGKESNNKSNNKPSKTAEPQKMEVYEDDFENDADDMPPVAAPKHHSSAKQSSIDRTPQPSAQKSKRKTTEKSSAFTASAKQPGARNTLSGTSKRSRSNEEAALEARGGNRTYGGYDWIEEDNMVRVIIRNDEQLLTSSPGRNGFKRYTNSFDRQRLILRSLYDIRRSRINNRDIVIGADLNGLLINFYNYDVKARCKSLKDLEKALENFAVQLSEEQKQSQKRTPTNDRGAGPGTKPPRHELYNEQDLGGQHKSKSLQYEKSSNSVNFLEPAAISSQGPEYLRKKSEKKNMQLQEAYKPILPNDIYKNYYGDTPRLYNKQASPRDKKFLLPLITQKPFAI